MDDQLAAITNQNARMVLGCPACGLAMRRFTNALGCETPECKFCGQWFRVPEISLVLTEAPEGAADEERLPAFSYSTWGPPTWRPTQDSAKVQWLRERLRVIEQQAISIKTAVCPACKLWSQGTGWSPDNAMPIKPAHRPDCWLRAEIDQLETGDDN